MRLRSHWPTDERLPAPTRPCAMCGKSAPRPIAYIGNKPVCNRNHYPGTIFRAQRRKRLEGSFVWRRATG